MMGKEGKKKKEKAGGKAAKKLKTTAAAEDPDPIAMAGAAAEWLLYIQNCNIIMEAK